MNRTVADWGGNIFAFIVVIGVNALANIIPLGGQTTGEVSAKYPSLFTPAGYVFSIWALIYFCLTVFIIWQALPGQRNNQTVASLRLPFQLNCLANTLWMLAWHYDFLLLSLVLMLVVLGSLIAIYRRLTMAKSTASIRERWIMYFPFSLYTGWITVATIANLSALQINQGWDDLIFSPQLWTVIKIAIAGTVAATVLFRCRDSVFVMVAVWATAGIAFKHSGVPMVVGAASVIALLGIMLIATELLTRPRTGINN